MTSGSLIREPEFPTVDCRCKFIAATFNKIPAPKACFKTHLRGRRLLAVEASLPYIEAIWSLSL